MKGKKLKVVRRFLFILVFTFAIIILNKSTEAAECAGGHNMHSTGRNAPATCVRGATTEWKCYKCGYTETRQSEPLGHLLYLYDKRSSTCSEQGYQIFKCGRPECHYYKNEPLALVEHKWDITTKAPTCVTAGWVHRTCTICGKVENITPGSSQGSPYAPTGIHRYYYGKCYYCGAPDPSVNQDTGGNTGGNTHTCVTSHSATCTTSATCWCGKVIEGSEPLGHNFTNGICTRCGESNENETNYEWDLTANGLTDNIGAVKAKLNTETGILTIIADPNIGDGKGWMSNYTHPGRITNASDVCPITNKGKIKKVEIKGNVKNIGSYLLYYASNLEEVIIENPDEIEYIGGGAFFGCKKLKKFTFPENITAIGARAFCHCHDLEKIDLSKATKLERIGHEAFRDCYSLENVTLPNGLKVIGYETFFNCISLENLIIPNSVVAIGTKGDTADEKGIGNSNQLTDDEKTLDNTSGYNNVFTIDFDRNKGQTEYEFYIKKVLDINDLTDILEILSKTRVWYYSTNNVIADYVGQRSTTEMKIGLISWDISEEQDKSVTAVISDEGTLTITGTGKIKDYEIGKTPWYGIKDEIKKVKIETGITNVGQYLFSELSEVTEINLPETITEIETGAFYGCINLKQIIIPENVKFIGAYAFYHCENIEEIILPEGITTLKGYTFSNCYRLKEVSVKGDIINIGEQDFFNCPSLKTFVVSPYIVNIGDNAFKIDFSDNEDSRYKEFENATLNKIKYYSLSEVMKSYVENNTERKFEAIDIDEIAIKTKPIKLEYFIGENLDTTGLVITATYYNGTTSTNKLKKEVEDGYTCKPETLETLGAQDITLTYGGKTETFNVNVKELEVLMVGVAELPTKQVYKIGETLDTEGLTLLVVYTNNTIGNITEGFTCTPTKLETEGTQTITVSYQGTTTTFTVTVNKVEPTLSSIKVKTKPSKLTYNVGDTLNTTGLVLTATYSDGTTKDISTGFTCTPTKLEKEGTQTITVSYEGKTTTFTVTVNKVAPTLSSIKVKTKPSKLTYNVGDTLNTTGLVLTATYSDGTTKDISTGFTCTPTKLEKEGTQTITVSYEGKTTTFTVTVNKVEPTLSSIKVKTKPSKLTYNVGDTLNTTGLVLTATYSDGTTKDISTGFTCTPTKLEKEGTQTITVSYGGKTTTFTVTVNKVTTGGLNITSDKYNISNSYITEIQPNTTFRNLKENIKTNATEVKVQKNGTALKDDEYVSTGIEIVFKLGSETKTYTILVRGDVNGDGKADFQDIVSANKHRLGKKTLAEAYALAGDITGDGIVDFKDIVRVNKYRLNKITQL